MGKKVFLLNGPSSSGKSTLAAALQKQIKDRTNEAYGIASIDDFLKMSKDEVIYEEDVFAVSSSLCGHVLDLLGSQPGVIIDHVITSERIFKQLMDALKGYDLCLVRVTCPLPELKRREKARQNRRVGSAQASDQYLFPQEGYDLTVDTYWSSIEDCVLRVMEALKE